MIDDTKYPITVGDLLDFLKTLDPEMPVCCERYSDMGYAEMPMVVTGVKHPTYVEWYEPIPGVKPGRRRGDDPHEFLPRNVSSYLLFLGN